MGSDNTVRTDRRTIHRIRVYDDLEDVRLYTVSGREREPFPGRIENISLGGMFVTARGDVPSAHRLSAELQIPGSRGFVILDGVVVHNLKPDDYFHGRGFGVAFQSLTPGARKALKRYVSAGLTRDRQKGHRPGFIRIDDPARILNALSAAAHRKKPLTLLPSESNFEVVSPISAFGTSEITLAVGGGDGPLREGRTLTVSFNVNFRSHSFDSRVVALHPTGVRIQIPEVIWINDKRINRRQVVDTDESERIEIVPPHRRRDVLTFPILERSEGGLSFRVRPGAPFFFEGTPLGQVRVMADTRVAVEDHAIVRHVSEIKDSGGALRIGIELGTTQALVRTVRAEPLRPKTVRSRLDRRMRQVRYLLTRGWQRFFPAEADPDAPPDLQKVAYQNAKGQKVVGLINRTFTVKRKCPVVVIPTAFSRRKESTVGLALTLIENFKRNLEHVAVVRFDYTNAVGESYRDPECDEEGREYLHFNTSNTIADLRATFDFAANNRFFEATEVILISFSLNSLTARTLLADTSRPNPVTYWIAPMGVADAQDAVKNCSGDTDLVGDHLRGETLGAANILGSIVDMDQYCADLVALKAATLNDAKDAMRRIDVPVTWLLGEHDGWVDPDRVRAMLAVEAPAARDILEVDAGHMPTRAEAFPYFNLLTRLVFKHVHGRAIEPSPPALAELQRISDLEWADTPKQVLEDQESYWSRYLVGETAADGFDVLLYASEYTDLMLQQARLLDLQPGARVLDLGCGTGNFLGVVLQDGSLVPESLEVQLVDFTGAGLEKARSKLDPLAANHPNLELDYTRLDIDLSRGRAIQRFIAGEEPSFLSLTERLEGLRSDVAERIWEQYSKGLHNLLRGDPIRRSDRVWLEASFQPADLAIIEELNRAARFFRSEIYADDLRADVESEAEGAAFSDLRLSSLGFGNNPDAMALPFDDESRDRILLSLVLSYLSSPEEVLLDAYRILRPGGRILVSSMRPDTESSLIYRKLVKRVQMLKPDELPPGVSHEEMLRSARTYAGTASSLVRLAEEGTFVFYGRGDLRRMLEDAGFRDVETEAGFGTPAQAYIATGVRP